MKYISWLLAALLLSIILSFSMRSPQPTLEIGLVNMGKIIDESPRAKQMTEQLTQRYNELLAEVQVKREEMDEEAQAELERSAYAAYLKFRQELETQFQIALDEAIANVAEAKNIKIVVDEELVRYGGKDLSSEVIRRLN